jgi:surface protein
MSQVDEIMHSLEYKYTENYNAIIPNNIIINKIYNVNLKHNNCTNSICSIQFIMPSHLKYTIHDSKYNNIYKNFWFIYGCVTYKTFQSSNQYNIYLIDNYGIIHNDSYSPHRGGPIYDYNYYSKLHNGCFRFDLYLRNYEDLKPLPDTLINLIVNMNLSEEKEIKFLKEFIYNSIDKNILLNDKIIEQENTIKKLQNTIVSTIEKLQNTIEEQKQENPESQECIENEVYEQSLEQNIIQEDNDIEEQNIIQEDNNIEEQNSIIHNIEIKKEKQQQSNNINEKNKIIFKPETKEILKNAINFYLNDRIKGIKKYGVMNDWDVSKITDMSKLFQDIKNFNKNISNWDVSNVKDMSYMFSGCLNFNQNIKNWNVSNVENMEEMFNQCKKFSQDIRNWNVSNVKNMRRIFRECPNFNKNIKIWDISNVKEKQV